jgi:hypothetical protein
LENIRIPMSAGIDVDRPEFFMRDARNWRRIHPPFSVNQREGITIAEDLQDAVDYYQVVTKNARDLLSSDRWYGKLVNRSITHVSKEHNSEHTHPGMSGFKNAANRNSKQNVRTGRTLFTQATQPGRFMD